MAKNILTTAPEIDYVEKAPEINSREFQKVVDSRRSVRVFDGTPIPERVMKCCLDNALLAPNSSNLQPWEFYHIRSAGKRNELVKACLDQVAARTAAELVVVVARTATWKENAREMLRLFSKAKQEVPRAAVSYYKKIVPLVYTLGPLGILGPLKTILFFVKGISAPILREPVRKSHMRIWAVKSTALGAQNLMLSLRAYGFDSCPMEGYDSKRIKKLLELPRDAVVVMVIAAGKRGKGGIYGERVRFDRAGFIKEV